MKKLHLLKMVFLLCALVVGSRSAWADTKTEDFENQSTSTTYNSTKNYTAANSTCGIAFRSSRKFSWPFAFHGAGCCTERASFCRRRAYPERWGACSIRTFRRSTCHL